MAEKTTHLGMAGHYASMSEFLLRGYNVATPVVDIGDDIYVVDDGHGLLRRVQVKTADGAAYEAALAAAKPGEKPKLQFNVSRIQLTARKQTPLYFMFLTYLGAQWRFLLLSQQDLLEIRLTYERTQIRSKSDKPQLTIKAAFEDDCFVFWDRRLPSNRWPADFMPLTGGPGARRQAPSHPAL